MSAPQKPAVWFLYALSCSVSRAIMAWLQAWTNYCTPMPPSPRASSLPWQLRLARWRRLQRRRGRWPPTTSCGMERCASTGRVAGTMPIASATAVSAKLLAKTAGLYVRHDGDHVLQACSPCPAQRWSGLQCLEGMMPEALLLSQMAGLPSACTLSAAAQPLPWVLQASTSLLLGASGSAAACPQPQCSFAQPHSCVLQASHTAAAWPLPDVLQTCHRAGSPTFLQPALCLYPQHCFSASPLCAADLSRRRPLHQPHHTRRCAGSADQRDCRHSWDSPCGRRWQWSQQWQAWPRQWRQQRAGCPWAGADPGQEWRVGRRWTLPSHCMQLRVGHAQAVLLHGAEPLLYTDLSSLAWCMGELSKPGLFLSLLPVAAASGCGGQPVQKLSPCTQYAVLVYVNAFHHSQGAG